MGANERARELESRKTLEGGKMIEEREDEGRGWSWSWRLEERTEM